MNETMTRAQKAGRTNHDRTVMRKKLLQMEREETKLMRNEMNAVLKSDSATHEEKVRAAEILARIQDKGSIL